MVYKFYYIVNNTYGHSTDYSNWNRWYFYKWFKAKGYTKAATAGIWGNIVAESSGGNPGQVEYGQTIPSYDSQGIPSSDNYRGGFGWIQWTNTSATSNALLRYSIDNNIAWYNGLLQCRLIHHEFDTRSWIPTSSYPYSGNEFKVLTNYETATKAYFYERERGTWSDARLNGAQAFMNTNFNKKPSEPTDPTLSYTIGEDSGSDTNGLYYWKHKIWNPYFGFTLGYRKR